MAAKGLGLLTFQSAIKGGVRPNLFSIEHGFPSGVAEPTIDGTGKPEEAVTYMCKAAALPATSVGTVSSAKGGSAFIQLRLPICAKSGSRVTLSRRVGSRWRLIGHGSSAG